MVSDLIIPGGKWANGDKRFDELVLSTSDDPVVKPKKDSKHVIIIGGGVSGLMSAWMLLDKGYRVTILAKDWAWLKDFHGSRITSQIAGALWEMPPRRLWTY